MSILTLNEESNLPGCLESVAWTDDVVVFDSYSTDQTVAIAKAAGARVFQRRFDNYATQRNSALEGVKYRHPWILMVDADERVTPSLKEEILATLSRNHDGTALYRVRRKDMFGGKWIRHSSGYPTWFGRLIRVGRVRVEREINEEYHTDGEIGHLKEHLLHYPFSKGIANWLERHNRYSSMEAETLLTELHDDLKLSRLFSCDPTVRRKLLKQLAYRLPLRPLLAFCYLYLCRLGFLDGISGFTYCRLRAMYEYMVDLKIKELGRSENGLPM